MIRSVMERTGTSLSCINEGFKGVAVLSCCWGQSSVVRIVMTSRGCGLIGICSAWCSPLRVSSRYTNHHCFVPYRETVIGMDMTSQHNAETFKSSQATSSDECFLLTWKRMALYCCMQDQYSQVRPCQNIIRIDNLHMI